MRRKAKKSHISFAGKIIISVLVILLISGVFAAYKIYHAIFEPNVYLGERKTTHLYIPTGSNFRDVKNLLYQQGMIINTHTFEWMAEKKNYVNQVKPGRYLIQKNMGNNELINLLRSGQQDPVKMTFNNIRTKNDLAGVIGRQLEADSMSIIQILQNSILIDQYGHNTETAALLFIPNTYEFFWNTSAEQLLERMHREYKQFWNADRLEKAAKLNLSPQQVGILASIVQQETSKNDELPRVAGVYINRLRRNMLLQADPTLIFAWNDFTIRRVLNRHKEIDSPYNTYKYPGLPPGPIALPNPRSIDGVLNYEKHEYLFFCAREDFSGYHAFARTYQQHLVNARRYQEALNKRRIMR